MLDTLVDDGLVECLDSGRYTMHQAISDYARLDSVDLTARQRFVDYFLRLTVENGDQDDLLGLELSNRVVPQ